jgi:hypothetical protein
MLDRHLIAVSLVLAISRILLALEEGLKAAEFTYRQPHWRREVKDPRLSYGVSGSRNRST